MSDKGDTAVLTIIMRDGDIDQEIFDYGDDAENEMQSRGNGGFAMIRASLSEIYEDEGNIRFIQMREGNRNGGDSRVIWSIGQI